MIAPPRKTLVVGVADMTASNDPGAELVTYSLGSCLGIAIFDPEKTVGGLLHVMLPSSSIDPEKSARSPFMFVDTGVPKLFRAVAGLGGDPARFVVKVAGGAKMMDAKDVFCIGQRNDAKLAEVLSRAGYTVHVRDVGGLCYRTMRMSMATGQVTIQSPGRPPYTL
ncbi:MAG: chemotaxis protein CheD [Verrucomicrobiales bacterium]|nr:chemotaxis protein CheD [Verrucomicrobiales bacterium]